ncbi:hypothetical protein CEXT_486801 [Caerostris extrusa]|uniref:Uncharacterized protein n=1 Tax=Caerostris extrusa TaxID=172846 RepID=A0AAV4PCL8_CAEEX|nr:hypothetical protein CEXT_486801 [Caerostris extrusa]
MVSLFNFIEWGEGDDNIAINRHQPLHGAVRARGRNGAEQGKKNLLPGKWSVSSISSSGVRVTTPEPLTDINISMKQSELEGVMARSRGSSCSDHQGALGN